MYYKMTPFKRDIAFYGIPCLLELTKLSDNQDSHNLSDDFKTDYSVLFSVELLALGA